MDGCRLALLAAGLYLAVASPVAQAVDIYAALGPDGTARWSTQALDASYTKVIAATAPTTPTPSSTPVDAPTNTGTTPPERALHTRRQAISPLIAAAAARHGLDLGLLSAVVEVESGFNTHAVSPKGARGLMQLMPATAQRYGMRELRELHEPARNLELGARHLKELLNLHGGHWALALAAYNAGQGAVARHGQRIPRYTETMLYVPTVLAKSQRTAAQSESSHP